MSEDEAIERIVLAQEAQAVALESIQRLLFQMLELQKEAEQNTRTIQRYNQSLDKTTDSNSIPL